MAKKQKVKRFSIQAYDAAHYRLTEQYTQAVEALFNRATDEVSRVAEKSKYNPDKPFAYADCPSVKSVMQDVVKQLASRMVAVVESGSRKQWLFCCDKNDAFIGSIMDTSKLTKARLNKMQDRNLDALSAFQKRKVDGLDLSQRVWKYVKQYRDQLEVALDVGLGEGRSAAQLSRDVRQNLKDPDRLFRRVRDKRGNLGLSKAAKAFHPGRGVYRSSYKNAMRLTRSEINMAYRESDYNRWQQLDFVVGFEVHRSNHEPLCKCDLCAKLVGRYPKTFKFKGWHPQCMCYAIPILMDDETFDANELGDLKAALHGTQYKRLQAKNLVTDVPEGFTQWVDDHADKQKNWGSTPYFIRDNFKNGQLSDGLKIALPVIILPAVKPISMDIANVQNMDVKQMVELAHSVGIEEVDFGNVSIEDTRTIMEAILAETAVFGKIPLKRFALSSFMGAKKRLGGQCTFKDDGNSVIHINSDSLRDGTNHVNRTIEAKIKDLESRKAKMLTDVQKWESKLGINKAADRMLKKEIKMMKSSILDLEIKIEQYKRDIANGHENIELTYSYSLSDSKARIKAIIHHEFGHLFDNTFNEHRGYTGKAYNSRYGSTSSTESFAEWYAQYMTGVHEGIPKELLNLFKKHDKGTFAVLGSVPSGLNSREQREWNENAVAIENKLNIVQGKEMTFEEANELRGNENYVDATNTPREYKVNCQCCVIANELRRRGFDVTAQANFEKVGSISHTLSNHTELAWLDKDGNTPISQYAGGRYYDANCKPKSKTYSVMMQEFADITKSPGRYHIAWGWKNTKYGHIVTAERLPNGGLRIYDAQNGKIIKDFKTYAKRFSLTHGIRVLRVDNLRINTSIINDVVKESTKK